MFPVKLFIDSFFLFCFFWKDREVKGWILGVLGVADSRLLG